MTEHRTPNGIDYSVNAMKQGDLITLAPDRNRHTDAQVREARRWCFATHTVIPGGVVVQWNNHLVRTLNAVQ